ncbi:Type II secretion system protein E [beta proteobacterium CB]|jgi:pilus assembly protein CpaF|nr:Type II secretion system protein E [beta proteobacterium CB]
MSLRETIQDSGGLHAGDTARQRDHGIGDGAYASNPLKRLLHARLLEVLDLVAIQGMSPEQLKAHLKSSIADIIAQEKMLISEQDLAHLVFDIQNEVIGLGPLEPLLADPTISDVLVNNYKTIFVERKGRLEKANIQFDDDAHLLKIIEKIVSQVGRRIDESSPMVDARLPDGSRVNAIIPPLALDGPALSIRRFSQIPLTMANLVEYGSLTEEMALIISALVKAKTNILVSGGTGSGKTTLLNIMSSFIPSNERIITIEDAAELRLQQPHVVRLETRPANLEGKGGITQRDLLRNTLRMRPDRIVIGEVRGAEVLDMLQAMNTGHEGSLTTIHANTARDSLTRLENMVGMAGIAVEQKALRQQIVAAITVIVQSARLSDGRRKVTSIQEITGMEGDMVTLQEIFKFEQTGVAPDGTVLGRFRATGIRPRFADRLIARGAPLADYLFDPDRVKE